MPTQISFSKINKAIAKRIREFYPDYPVYNDYPESNMNLPCFVLKTSGGNLRKRLNQEGKDLRGIAYERFTLEFFSVDIAELQDVGYELRVLLDTVETDDGELYRCTGKNVIFGLTENHTSLTFRVRSEPYIEKDPDPRMTSLNFNDYL